MVSPILKGKLVEKNPTHVVIECSGVGYFVNISLHTFSKIGDSESIQLFTHLQVKEDSHTLFGFAEKSEREIFQIIDCRFLVLDLVRQEPCCHPCHLRK